MLVMGRNDEERREGNALRFVAQQFARSSHNFQLLAGILVDL
jgi:hypothetical protein